MQFQVGRRTKYLPALCTPMRLKIIFYVRVNMRFQLIRSEKLHDTVWAGELRFIVGQHVVREISLCFKVLVAHLTFKLSLTAVEILVVF